MGTERRTLTRCVVIGALLVGALALAGCGTVKEVDLPVPVTCVVGVPPDPALPVADVGQDAPDSEVIRAMAATIDILKDRVKEDDQILAACVSNVPQDPHAWDSLTR